MIWVITDVEDMRRHGPAPWKAGFVLPRRFTATINDTDKADYRIELWLSVRDCRVECDRVQISRRREDGPPTGAARLPLDRYVELAATGAAHTIPGGGAPEPVRNDKEQRAASRRARPERRARRRKTPAALLAALEATGLVRGVPHARRPG